MNNLSGPHQNQKINELERQIERSGFFTHNSLSVQAERINEIESILYGLVDLIIDKEGIQQAALEETVHRVQNETLEKNEQFHPGIAVRVNGEQQSNVQNEPVNCDERLHICKAACCRLHFALSVEEIESGKSKWDLGQPYFIRQDKDGCCTHLDKETRRCTNYQDRPGVCRNYSCKEDNRIWSDFDKMELNEEWIREHLTGQKIELQELHMIPDSAVEYRSRTKPESD